MDELFLTEDLTFFDAPYGEGHARGDVYDLSALLPHSWKSRYLGIWCFYRPGTLNLPEGGWKLHISATQAEAADILGTVATHCFQAGLPFKHLRTSAIHMVIDSKSAERASSGKFMTIYPPHGTEPTELADQLGRLLDGQNGPYIITDMRWRPGSPVHLRFGAYREVYAEAPNGRLVPGLRGPAGDWTPDHRGPFRMPAGTEVPADLLAARRRELAATHAEFPYHAISALHFSNAGGVYLAERDSDGCRVVLKEGRPHAGLDANGDDAATRTAHEAGVLRALQGLPGIPAIYRFFTASDNAFLEMEYIDGRPLNKLMAQTYPMTSAFPTRWERQEYRRRMQAIVAEIRRIVQEVHDRGYVIGDIHPRNVLVRGYAEVYLIDFEVAAPADSGRKFGMGHQGYSRGDQTGYERDLYALDTLELCVYAPVAELIWFDSAKRPLAEKLVDNWFSSAAISAAPDDLEVEAAGLGLKAPAWREIAQAVLSAATPQRGDRLYPGDPAQFTHHPGALAHGAGGVIWALSGVGLEIPEEHLTWFRDVCLTHETGRVGLFDGYAGAILGLAAVGMHRQAETLAERLFHTLGTAGDHGLGFGHGAAGVAACLLELPSLRDSAETQRVIERFGARCLRDIEHAERHGSTRHPGLAYGYSGIAVASLRLADATDDSRFLDIARRAVALDLGRTVRRKDGSQLVDYGDRLLPYVNIGSAGILLAARELVLRDLLETEALAPLALACGGGFIAQAQLGFGRAGLLAALATIAGADDETLTGGFMRRHVTMLALDALRVDAGVMFLGEQLARCSTDYLTGSAGVARALAAVESGHVAGFPFITPRIVPEGSGAFDATVVDAGVRAAVRQALEPGGKAG